MPWGRVPPIDKRQKEREFAPAGKGHQLDGGDDVDPGSAPLIAGIRVGRHGVVVGTERARRP